MILDDIVAVKRRKLAQQKITLSIDEMAAQIQNADADNRFLTALKSPGLSVIAEVKKASPSKGVICEDFHPERIAQAYEKCGADAVSVLTEEDFFHGSNDYLSAVANTVCIPVLRKDFMIDIWQVYEARYIGAQAILLIAAILSERQLREYREAAQMLGMYALVETHDINEMQKALDSGAEIIGINNRNLKTFDVSLETTERLIKYVPSGKTVVSESGIMCGADARFVTALGADAVLVGESLMCTGNIEEKMKELKQT